jgi:hypothetical protein
MPTYTFFDEDTKETFDMFLSMAEREKYLKGNPQIRQVPVAVAISGDHIMGVGPKTDGGFNERMQQINKNKSHKEIKTRNVLKKHKVI